MIIANAERRGGGVDPATRVLTADLCWLPIADVEVGQELVACDEHRPPRPRPASVCRKMRISVVEMVRRTRGPAVRIRMDDGRSVVCAADCRWLSLKGRRISRWRSIGGPDHIGHGMMGPGGLVRSIARHWGARDHQDSWFGGMIDGEGSFAYQRGGAILVVSQCDGPVLHRMLGHCIARGYSHLVYSDRSSKLSRRPVHGITFNGMSELFRVMGLSRPVRFIGVRWWEGKRMPNNGWHAVAAIDPLGERDLVEIRTSTRTYIAEGFVAHDATGVAANVAPPEGRPRAAFALPEPEAST